MSAQDIWARKYHKLWEKLEKNTKDSFCTALWKWIVSLVNKQCNLSDHAEQLHHCCLVPHKNMRTQAWCNDKGYDTTIHPIVKCVLFLEDLLAEMVAKNSKDPFGNIRVARKALSKIRCALLTAPHPVTVCYVFAF